MNTTLAPEIDPNVLSTLVDKIEELSRQGFTEARAILHISRLHLGFDDTKEGGKMPPNIRDDVPFIITEIKEDFDRRKLLAKEAKFGRKGKEGPDGFFYEDEHCNTHLYETPGGNHRGARS